jgi:hypothetical protein
MGVFIKDEDHTDEFIKQLQQIDNAEIKIGLFADEDKKSKNGASLILVGVTNEFGATIKSDKARKWLFAQMKELGIKPEKRGGAFITIPERAWLRKAFDDSKNIDHAMSMGIEDYNRHSDFVKMLYAIGLGMQSGVVASITSNLPPPNHPFTVVMKDNKNQTLVDTGRLSQGVTFKVEGI